MTDCIKERLNLTTEQLRAIFSRPVAYHKLLAIAGGSVSAGVFLSQLIYWTDKTQDPDGWIYKTLDDWWAETALGRYELKTIRTALVFRKLIQEKLCGVPAKLHYKIEWDMMTTALAKAVVTHREGLSKRGAPTNKYVALPQTGEATNKHEAQPQATYRAESTTESTTTKSISAMPPASNGNGFHPVVIVSLDGLLEEFGPFNAIQRRSIAEEYERDTDYVLRQAEIVRSEPRANAAKAFLAALRDDWQPRKVIAKPKREKPQPVIQEPVSEPTEEEWASRKAAVATMRAAINGTLEKN